MSMEIQLQFKRTNKYCFVYDATKPRSKNPQFELEFVEFVKFEGSNDGENKTIRKTEMELDQWANEWKQMKIDGWHIVDA